MLAAALLLIAIVSGTGGYLLGIRNSRTASPSQLSLSPGVKISATITQSTPVTNLPPDPGEAGKATVAGIYSDHDGVRDDVQRYIELTITDSARHREALKNVARNTQRELLAKTKEEAIQLAIEGTSTVWRK